MNEKPTTAAIQRCMDALQEDTSAEPLIRDLLERAVRRLRLSCSTLRHRSYSRLTQPPLNVETDELLDGVVAGLRDAGALEKLPLDQRAACLAFWKEVAAVIGRAQTTK
jgi:RNA polymerase sigma-70 factor (ECF subfamily)